MSRRKHRQRHPHPTAAPVDVSRPDPFVGLQIICKSCDRPLLIVRRSTDPTAPPELELSILPGVRAGWSQFAGEDYKLLIKCGRARCPATPEVLRDKLEHGLAQMWAPMRHAVIDLPL